MICALRPFLGFFALLIGGLAFSADPDLSDYRTVDKAITTTVKKSTSTIFSQPGYLGLHLSSNDKGIVTVEEIATESPAAKSGIQRGDTILAIDGKSIKGEEGFYDTLNTKLAGDTLKVKLSRQNKPIEVTATLTSRSKPMSAGKQQAALGIQVASIKDGEGVSIQEVLNGSPAERARLKVGEVILKADDKDVSSPEKLKEFLATKKPDDIVTLTLLLAEKRVEMKVVLGAEQGGGRFGGGGAGWNARANRYWTKPTYKIAIINIDYPDAKHNSKITAKAWEESMFSKGSYKVSATGSKAYGSMYDYYFEQSYGQLKIEGKSFEHVEVSKKRMEYGGRSEAAGGGAAPGGERGGARTALLVEAMDKLLAREGKDALKGFDGVFFIYSGARANVARGSLYWPHRSSFNHNGTRWDYFICGEGGATMGNISVFCHEFGHMLGLPDLYARPENPGMEGAGIWTAMANQAGAGRPQHFDAWCKEKLGWIKPVVIDPTVKQKLILGPIEDSPKECYKVLVRPDGGEYFLLENRRKKGFDASLRGEGLLIWRVVGNRPILEESHGISGPAGPGSFLKMVPFPSLANDSFTPYTIPSSRSQLGGGLPVHITHIQNLPDGRIAFQIGYEYQ